MKSVQTLKNYSNLLGFVLLCASLVWIALRSGVRPFILLEGQVRLGAVWPTLPPSFEIYNPYTLGSPAGLAIFRISPFTTEAAFVWQHFLAISVGLLILVAVAHRTLGGSQSWQVVRFLVLGSLGAVLFHWLGIYDAYTFLFWTFMLLSWSLNSWPLFTLSSVLLGFQHLNQALFGLLAFLLVLWIFQYWSKKTWLLAYGGFAGLVIGKLLQVMIYWSAGTDLRTTAFGREGIAFSLQQTRNELANSLRTGPILLWSLFAGFWIVVIVIFKSLESSKRGALAAVMVVLFLVSAIAGDKTRVFVMMAFPMMFLVAIFFFREGLDKRARGLVEPVLWLSVPLIVFANSVLPIGWRGSLLDEVMTFPAWIP